MYFVSNYDKVPYFKQINSNTCLTICICWVLAYHQYKNLNKNLYNISENISKSTLDHPSNLDYMLNPFLIYQLAKIVENHNKQTDDKIIDNNLTRTIDDGISMFDVICVLNHFDQLKQMYNISDNILIKKQLSDRFVDLNLSNNYKFDIKFGHNLLIIKSKWDIIIGYLNLNMPLILSVYNHMVVIIGYSNNEIYYIADQKNNDISTDIAYVHTYNTIAWDNLFLIDHTFYLIWI